MTRIRVHKLKAKAFYDLRKQEENTIKLSFDCQKKYDPSVIAGPAGVLLQAVIPVQFYGL